MQATLRHIDLQKIQQSVETLLKTKFGISHITLQIEYKGCEDNDELISGGGETT
ncbi:MAG: hypothetical protein BWY08_00400 [Bacteroidetes bacterium ADurb.Bin174]|nr:MAG: hypothetical protein BWY08_00400 [Bacteroidetes bacterium ADurb.Bin174]